VDRTELTLPTLVSLLRFGHPIPVTDGAGMLVAVRVAEGSPLDGKTVAEGFEPLPGTIAVAILHGEEMTVPGGATRLSAGDQVIAVANEETYRRLRELAADTVPAESEPG